MHERHIDLSVLSPHAQFPLLLFITPLPSCFATLGAVRPRLLRNLRQEVCFQDPNMHPVRGYAAASNGSEDTQGGRVEGGEGKRGFFGLRGALRLSLVKSRLLKNGGGMPVFPLGNGAGIILRTLCHSVPRHTPPPPPPSPPSARSHRRALPEEEGHHRAAGGRHRVCRSRGEAGGQVPRHARPHAIQAGLGDVQGWRARIRG